MMENVSFKLNGKPISLTIDSERKLLWVLRTNLGLTGTKYGCGEGFCGACTVLVNNKTVRSCRFAIKNVNLQPTRAEIIQNMDYNLCRCGSYQRIIQAIESAAKRMKGVK